MDPNTILKIKKYIKRRLKVKLQIIPPTIFINIGRPLAIIVHYTVLLNFDCCKSSVPDMGPNTILKIKKYTKRRLKVNLKKIPTYNLHKLW